MRNFYIFVTRFAPGYILIVLYGTLNFKNRYLLCSNTGFYWPYGVTTTFLSNSEKKTCQFEKQEVYSDHGVHPSFCHLFIFFLIFWVSYCKIWTYSFVDQWGYPLLICSFSENTYWNLMKLSQILDYIMPLCTSYFFPSVCFLSHLRGILYGFCGGKQGGSQSF